MKWGRNKIRWRNNANWKKTKLLSTSSCCQTKEKTLLFSTEFCCITEELGILCLFLLLSSLLQNQHNWSLNNISHSCYVRCGAVPIFLECCSDNSFHWGFLVKFVVPVLLNTILTSIGRGENHVLHSVLVSDLLSKHILSF